MTPIVAWFLTLFAAIIIIGLFAVAHLDAKYKEHNRQLKRQHDLMYKKWLEAVDDNELLRIRIQTQRQEMMAKGKSE